MQPTKQQIISVHNKILNDPIYFCEEVLGVPLWEKEREILLSVRDHKETAVRSCHASGKSFTAARVIHWWLSRYVGNAVVITTAPTFRQVKEILWREIKNAVSGKHIYPKDTILDTQINLGPKYFALGLSTDKPDQFQGFHSPHLLMVFDEASGIPPEIYEAADGLAPERILMIGNPLENTGRFADSFKLPNVNKIHISAFDTPNIKENKIVIPGLITTDDINRMAVYYGTESDVYKVRVLGEFPSLGVNTLIGVDEVANAIERSAKVLEHWEKKMGVDPARFGDDRTAIVVRQMEKVIRKETRYGLNTMQIVGLVLQIAKEEKVLAPNISIDAIGIGAGVVDRLQEQSWDVKGVNVSEKADDEEHYLNLRAELFAGKIKEWIKTADLPKDDDFYELANIKYKFNSKGQMQLESKEDMKKRGLNSPDVADALAMTFASPIRFVNMVATEALLPYDASIGF